MIEREKLEREIHQLTQIIGANAFALVSKSTPIADRARLQKQIDIRTTMWAGLLKQLGGDPKPGHRGTERRTCASQTISTKRSSRRGHCHKLD
jgi:hypothetical protein